MYQIYYIYVKFMNDFRCDILHHRHQHQHLQLLERRVRHFVVLELSSLDVAKMASDSPSDILSFIRPSPVA